MKQVVDFEVGNTFSFMYSFYCMLNVHAFTIITYRKRIRKINVNKKQLS